MKKAFAEVNRKLDGISDKLSDLEVKSLLIPNVRLTYKQNNKLALRMLNWILSMANWRQSYATANENVCKEAKHCVKVK